MLPRVHGRAGGERETSNDLLDAVPAVDREQLLACATPREMTAGDLVFDAGQRIDSVWFPVAAVVSILTVLQDGTSVESATIGRESMVGIPVFLGEDRSGNGRGVVQMSGGLLRVGIDDFRKVLAGSDKLQSVVRAATAAFLFHVSQSVACTAAHPVRERLARWLLQTSDRTVSDEITLTQQFLSEILHTRRASVTDALASLEADGALRRRRGGISLLDRDSLLSASCECYEMVRREHERSMLDG